MLYVWQRGASDDMNALLFEAIINACSDKSTDCAQRPTRKK